MPLSNEPIEEKIKDFDWSPAGMVVNHPQAVEPAETDAPILEETDHSLDETIAPDPRSVPSGADIFEFPSQFSEHAAQSVPQEPASRVEPTEEIIERITRRVMERLSDRVVRDIAQEAVPRIAEKLIREALEEESKT